MTQPVPDPKNAALAATAQFILKLATLGFIPKGWQTRVMSALTIVAGVGLIASHAAQVISTGEMPTDVNFSDAFGLLMMGTGGATAGIGRKIEAVSAKLSALADVLKPPTP